MYRAVRTGHLRAARFGRRRTLRFLERWIDDWFMAGCVEPSDEPSAIERRTSPWAGMSTVQRVHWDRGTDVRLSRSRRHLGTGPRRNATFPSRQYTVTGDRRSFALLGRSLTPLHRNMSVISCCRP